MTRTWPALCALLLLASGPAAPDDSSAQSKEVAELRREVRELRAMLRVVLDRDRQCNDLLTNMLGTSPGAQAGNEPTKGDSPPPTPPKTEKGTITGKVPLPESGVAFVYVERNGVNRLVHGRTIEIRQVNKQFQPRWAVVQQGTEIRFPNFDSTYHNVFSNSSNASFDLGLELAGDPGKSYVFSEPGIADIYCNQHPEMSATVLVVPNPYFTQVAPDGTFTLNGILPGRHKVVAWTPHAEPVSKWVTVEPGGSVSVSLQLGKSEERAHLNKRGKEYGSYDK